MTLFISLVVSTYLVATLLATSLPLPMVAALVVFLVIWFDNLRHHYKTHSGASRLVASWALLVLLIFLIRSIL